MSLQATRTISAAWGVPGHCFDPAPLSGPNAFDGSLEGARLTRIMSEVGQDPEGRRGEDGEWETKEQMAHLMGVDVILYQSIDAS